MADDDDEGGFGGMYEDGHWMWDDTAKSLVFVSDLPPKPVEAIQILAKAPTGTIEFRDDVDLIEQDAKDIAIYTAPIQILSPVLINMLHLSTTERFIRALILYSAYYLQIADEMANRIIELETKIRTPDCELLENEYRDNLADLRVLVAKEYSVMLIELETNRIFKSEIFNAVEHNLKTGYISKMSKEERLVLLGHCLRYDKKLNTRSPLMNEVFCHRKIDHDMMGLGVIKVHNISTRLQYMLQAISGPEEKLMDLGVIVGILGMPRTVFDTMLRPLPTASETGKSKASMSSASGYNPKSSSSMRKSTMAVQKLYPNIVLPRKETREKFFPSAFPDEPDVIRHCSETQRRRWQTRLQKLLHPYGV